MATTRLVFETSENLDARTIAHTPLRGFASHVKVTSDAVAVLDDAGVTVFGIDGETRWSEALDAHIMTVGIVGDELFAVSAEAIDVWGLAGGHRRRMETGIDWDVTHIAFDEVGGQVAFVGAESQAVIVDLTSGERLHDWDMTEDYDFSSDWTEIGAVLFRAGRVFLVVGQQISVWMDGELEFCEWRRGKQLKQYSDEAWGITDEYLFEVNNEGRGLVVYDIDTLELVAQPGVTGDFCAGAGGHIATWSDQHVSVWDGESSRFYKPDWRCHYHACLTPDGRHAVSVSLRGELCVQRVADFEQLEAEAPRMWAAPQVTAFATNPAGTRAAVVCGIQNAMAHLHVLDLEKGTMQDVGKVHPTQALHFLDDERVFGTTGRWVDPAAVTTWSEGDAEATTIEVPGAFLGSGEGWIATKDGDADRAVVFRALEGGELHEMKQHELPEGFSVQHVANTRWAHAWDEDYNSVLVDLETGNTVESEDGDVGGDFVATTEWDDEYLLRVRELPSGNEVGVWKGSVSQVLVMQGRQVFFNTHEGQLFSWVPPDAPKELFASPDLGMISLSSDERYIVCDSAPLRLFDVGSPSEPVLEVTFPFATVHVQVAGDYLLVAGFNGMYSVYAIEA